MRAPCWVLKASEQVKQACLLQVFKCALLGMLWRSGVSAWRAPVRLLDSAQHSLQA